MNYLPYENITYKTRLTEDELIKRLEENTEPKKLLRFGILGIGKTKTYEGDINRQEFSIQRIIWYRNSFLPRITGTMLSELHGTRIDVKMRLHPWVIIFSWFWCSCVGLVCIGILTQAFDNSVFSLIPFGMLLFYYTMTMGAFKFESVPTKKALQKLFDAEMIEE